MSHSLLDDLNKEQQLAVKTTDGPILILAGAGSGKTRVLTYKAAYLVMEKGIDPLRILMVTFTNKAAEEMKNRISKLINQPQGPYAGTFHSFAARLIRREGYHIKIPSEYVIYDEKDSLDAINEVMKQMNISTKDFNPRSLRATISQAKNEMITSGDYPQYARGYFQKVAALVYQGYDKFLKKNDALDFDDLLLKSVQLLRDIPTVANYYQEKYQYVLVDEYQDTNKVQYTLTKLLGKKHKNICIVGDASQSIYSWRGADYRNILNFQNDNPGIKVFNLEQNYRSTKKILDAATNIISKNTTHPILELWTENQRGDNIILFEARNEHDEATFIINTIKNALDNNSSLKFKDFALLYRTNAQSRVLEEAFLREGLPYQIIGGVQFYERKEIKDVIAYLRLLYNPKDLISYKRLEKIGKRRLEKFLVLAEKFKLKSKNQMTTLEILDNVLDNTGYQELYDKKVEEDRNRLENIKELRSVATEFPRLADFLENISLVQQEHLPVNNESHLKFKPDKKDVISLLTMHAAKGLEYKYVFIVGMEEGLFPHSQSLMDKLELEEERRLCYVAITRAKNNLFLSYATKRLYFGQRTNNMPSRFLTDIPEHLITFRSEYNLSLD